MCWTPLISIMAPDVVLIAVVSRSNRGFLKPKGTKQNLEDL